MKTSESVFGTLPDGRRVALFTVESASGMSFSAMSYGCTLTALRAPDRRGAVDSVILGFPTLDEYVTRPMCSGTVVGRFANRISRGRFTLDGREFTLACNEVRGEGPGAVRTHIHGGVRGFDKVLWDARPCTHWDAEGVRFTYRSRDGEEGYPGNLSVAVTYTLNEAGELALEYEARTDAPTPVNLTNHAYWNLRGAGSGPMLDQEAVFFSSYYLPTDAAAISTGEIRSVRGTPFDFTVEKPIGRDISGVGDGYDNCFVIARPEGGLGPACRIRDPVSGRVMDVRSTMPGFHFYTGNYLDGRTGAEGKPYGKHGAFCIETEHFPDCVNIGHFPSCILRPGQTYHHLTIYRLSV